MRSASIHRVIGHPIKDTIAALDRQLRAVVSGVRFDYVWLGILAGLAQSFYSLTPIGFEGDAFEYYLYAHFLSGFDPTPFVYDPPRFIYYRPPGYPIFLLLTGLVHLNTFRWTLFVSGLIGVVCPLLLYGIVVRLGRQYAIAAALLYIASTLPFSYSNVFLADHLYTALVLGTLLPVSRSLYQPTAAGMYVGTALALCAMLTRNEAWVFFLLAVVSLLFQSVSHRRLIPHFVFAFVLGLTLTLFWSHLRSQYLAEPRAFGSLSNFSGRQTFWRVYVSLPVWEHALREAVRLPIVPAETGETDFGRGTLLVSRSNGPWSESLYQLIARDGEDPLAHPTSAESWAIGEVVTSRLGYVKADRLFRRVVRETLLAHPTAVLALLTTSLDYLGINSIYCLELLRTGELRFFPIFRVSVDDEYERIPLNHSGIALRTLMHPRLRREYIDSYHPKPAWFWPLHSTGQVLSKIMKNLVGVSFLTCLVCLVWLPRRHWPSALLVGAVAGSLIAAATIGYGYSTKYHHTILPVLLIGVCYELRGLQCRLTRAPEAPV